MKNRKFFILAASLIAGAMLTTLSAQEHQWSVQKGDSVKIKPECTKYLTGETPSSWVWDKVHVVYQLGTKRFPEGVLLMNIRSWISEDCLIIVNDEAKQRAKAKAAHAEQPAQEEQPATTEQAATTEQPAQPAQTAQTAEPGQPAQTSEPAPVVVPVAVAATESAPAEEPAQTPKKEEPAQAEQPAPTSEPAPVVAPVVVATTESAQTEEPAQTPQKVESAQTDETAQTEQPAQTPKSTPIVGGKIYERAKGDTIHSMGPELNHAYNRFTIGLRGGAASLMHQADKGAWTCGGNAVLDLQYAHYWAKYGRPVDLGIIVGLGAGYTLSGLKANDEQVKFDAANVNYTVTYAGVKETDHQLQLEVPLLFSLIHAKGLFFNVGPKFMIPVYSPYKQTVNQEGTHISAYFPEYGITINDNTVTGKYTGQQPEEKNGILYNINVMLTAEIGYEWILKNGDSFGLGAYANYSVFNTYSNKTNPTGLFVLTPPTDDASADLKVLSATRAYTNKLGYFDAGIKLAYHFNFPKKRK